MAGNSCGLDGGNVVLEVIPVIVLRPTVQRRFSQLLPGIGGDCPCRTLSVPGAAGTGADTKRLPPGLRAALLGGSAGSTSPATMSRTQRDVELAQLRPLSRGRFAPQAPRARGPAGKGLRGRSLQGCSCVRVVCLWSPGCARLQG